MKLATIKDIAKRLGINHGTVSRALNNDPRISGATKALVVKTARLMNYSPNTYARGLAGGRSNTIAAVTPAYFSMYSADIMRGIETEIIKTDYDLDYYTTRRFSMIGTAGRDVYIFEKILNERKADAVITISGNVTGRGGILSRYKKAGIQVIFVEGKGDWGHRVHYDNMHAAALAVEHLIEKKCKKPGMLIGNTRDVESYKERLAGFKKAMKDRGMRTDGENIFSFYEEYQAMPTAALNFFLEKKIDGVYSAAGDYTAFRFYNEAARQGIRIPDDIALVGQDNSALSRAAEITTINQPIVEMGEKAVEIAARAIESGDLKNMRDELFHPELIIRKST